MYEHFVNHTFSGLEVVVLCQIRRLRAHRKVKLATAHQFAVLHLHPFHLFAVKCEGLDVPARAEESDEEEKTRQRQAHASPTTTR